MGYMKKSVPSESDPKSYVITDETDARNLKRVYLIHDQGYYLEHISSVST